MRLMRLILNACLLILTVTPAEAGPVIAAIGAIVKGIGLFAAANVFNAFIVNVALSVGLSLLAKAVRGKPKVQQSGIQTDVTTTGGTTPQKFILGRYATGGQLVAPPMSYGSAGDTPNAYLVYVIALSAAPGVTLSRVIVDDDYIGLGTAGANWGKPATGDLAGFAWVDFKDGTQTAAHPDLIAAFSGAPDRPWSSDMIGPGTAYAVCRFLFNRERFSGLPSVRFELIGIPLYDPRADSTAGGSGAQRWATPATWAQTQNPAVMIYNILRGIRMPDGQVWGGEATEADLPFAVWAAAMNECDVVVDTITGGTSPQYRAGFEVAVDMTPADVIDEILKTCSGQLVEIGGVWKLRCGAPGLSVLSITDDDVIASQPEDYEPFPGLSETWNGITSTYPEPDSLWESKDAPPRFDATWEAADGGRRLVAELSLPACSYRGQVQRLMAQSIADHRRFRSHRLSLPPEAAVLEPLDAIAWTSARNGYTGKVFEVTGLVDNLATLTQTLMLRERDSADYAWSPGSYLATIPAAPGVTPPAAQSVPGWAVSSTAIDDGASDRRPSISLQWSAASAIDARGIVWELRRIGGAGIVTTGTHSVIASGLLRLTEGVLAATAYEVRGRLIVDRPTEWTAWTPVTTPDVRLGLIDFNGQKRQLILPGPLTIPAGFSGAVGNLEVGYLGLGSVWLMGITFQARQSPGSWRITLQRRFLFGGVWQSWNNWMSWDIDSYPNYWRFHDGGIVTSGWDNYQTRLWVQALSGTPGECLRNVYLTFILIAD